MDSSLQLKKGKAKKPFTGDDSKTNANLIWQLSTFNYYAKYCSQKISDFVLKREQFSVYPNIKPGYLRSLLPASIPENPQAFKRIIDDFFTYILPGTAHWNHSKFVAYYPSGNAFANIYGDMLSTAFGGVGFSWTAQPSLSELENVMMDWFGRALGLPSHFIFADSKGEGGGCTHNTASDAIYTTIVAARHIPLKEAGCYPDPDNLNNSRSSPPHPGIILQKLVAYTSEEAHSCVEKGCRIALCTLRILKSDHKGSLNGSALETAIKNDSEKNLIPFYCCATLGTTGTCSFDDLKTIGPICKQYKVYLHVDAAYAGNAFILRDMGWLKEGLEYADSIEINPYKLMLGAVDLCCLFVKNVMDYKAPFFIDATYLLDEFANESDKEIKRNEIDYRHYGIALSRRMRSLKLYFLFRLHGMNALRQYIQDIRHMATTFEGLVYSDKRFEVLNTVKLGLVVFRQKPQSQDDDNSADSESSTLSTTDKKNMNLLLRINKSRDLHLVPCITKNRFALRVSMNYEHLTNDHINEMMTTLRKHYVEKLDTSLVRHFKRSPGMTLDAASKFVHLLDEDDYPAFEERQKNPATYTIPLTFGPIFVPPLSKSTVTKIEEETNENSKKPQSKTTVFKSKMFGPKKTDQFGTKIHGASNYISDDDSDNNEHKFYDDDDD